MVIVLKSLWRSPNFCPMQRQIKNITLSNLVCSRIAVERSKLYRTNNSGMSSLCDYSKSKRPASNYKSTGFVLEKKLKGSYPRILLNIPL